MRSIRSDSLTVQVLLAFVPLTRQNLLLSFKPNQFFDELERTTGRPRRSIQNAYYRAKKSKHIYQDATGFHLSFDARRSIQPFVAKKLNGAQLMVIFDIPETHAHVRQEFRLTLVELKFKQIQRSVWVTDMDHAQLLRDLVVHLGAADWVKIYEAVPLDTQHP